MTENLKTNKKIHRWFIFTVLLLTILAGTCGVYLLDYHHADLEAIDAFAPIQPVSQTTLEDGTIVFEPENTKTGFIFYPGGKVEHIAYIPLMQRCASEGILCVLVEMPFRLAVFDINAADGIRQQYPEIENWYIGGHSLGGSMAASYLAEHIEDFSGLILLGSYSTEDLSGTDLTVLSIYGSEDQVLNKEKYMKNRSNLPPSFIEVVINGGCHANFGMYGPQNGDGVPSITTEEQIHITVTAIMENIQ